LRKNRHKQHEHNWSLGFTDWRWEERKTEYSSGGYNAKRYWRCIRGGVVKHTKEWDARFSIGLAGERIILGENVFLMASGVFNVENSY